MPIETLEPEPAEAVPHSDVRKVIPPWSWVVPVAAWLAIALVGPGMAGGGGMLLLGAALFATVFAAVHHAEVIAHRIGEPFGTLVLALAVTVIEVALIVSIMLSAKGTHEASLARDTVFAAVMLVCNGVLGLCLLVAGIRFGEPVFRARAASSYLAVLAVLATASLVLPEFTHSAPGPVYTHAQLIFVAVVAVVLYGVFLFVQTVRHRDYFLPAGADARDAHAAPPSTLATGIAALILPVALGAVVLLAKTLSPELEAAMRAANVAEPAAAVGVVVAALVLLPEAVSAVRAARVNRLQTSVNLALGSALASIALTIPAVAAVALWTGQPLTLGLGDTGLVFLALTFVVTTLTLSSGRATILQGAIHLAILALFLFLVIVP
nr:ionic transporter y4hA [Polymorphobacter sp.]